MNMLNFTKNKAPDSATDEREKDLPVDGQDITLDIFKIEVSRFNPRTSRAEDYDSHKESIKQAGLLQRLTVTKLPDVEYYEIYSGGNTRLTILKELYEEYQAQGEPDKANEIRYQQCTYTKYINNLDILVKHMAENEERSNMTFIDKARAVFQIKAMYLEQEGLEKISSRKLVEQINAIGWKKVNQQSVTELNFAYEKLNDVIPLALNQGMGRPKIQQLRLWLDYALTFVTWWVEKHGYDYSTDKAEQLYFEVLAEQDDDIEPINLDDFYQDYLYRLSTALMSFDSSLKMDVLRFELGQVADLGYVPEEQPQEQLSQQLKETATVPPFEYPEPRKPRKVKTDTDNDNKTTETVLDEDSTDALVDTGETASDNDFAIAAKTTSEIKAASTDSTSHVTDPLIIAETGKQESITIFTHILSKYDLTGRVKELVEYGDEDNSLHVYPPYFSLNLSDEDKRIKMTNIILSAEWPVQYLVLHLLNIYVTYHQNEFDSTSMTKDETTTYKNLMKIWQEFCPKYCNYVALCQTGLIERNLLQRRSVTEVHRLLEKHLAVITAFEVSQMQAVDTDGDGGV